MSCPALVRLLCTAFVPFLAFANPGQTGGPDCKSLISHSGFAEFVMPSGGGMHELAIKVPASAKWTVRNSGYVDWIRILSGDSGTGPGTLRVQLEANTTRFCRVGVLTISGLTRIYGLPITILQRGVETDANAKPAKPSQPSVVNLAPFSTESPAAPPHREYKKVVPKR